MILYYFIVLPPGPLYTALGTSPACLLWYNKKVSGSQRIMNYAS
jgi:hypothetical protein